MEHLAAGLVLVTAITALNAVLTLALVRRWRSLTSSPPDAHDHHDHDHDGAPDLGIAPGSRMPAFSAVAADGSAVTRETLIGRPALVAFLSLDCSGCDDSLPAFAERARRVREAGGRVLATVVGVDAAGSELAARLRDLADHVVPEFLDAPVGARFGARYYPGFAHYDADGIAVTAGVGLAALDAPDGVRDVRDGVRKDTRDGETAAR
ncbi:redoxin domain-containing protein [Nonomuraea sp. NPDC049725]|uniref:peroxiredoxin family protein n=1 Tax=Nonomuraea sp. NPDC049725 TaxID=3154508 RepID=UPI00341ED269